MGAFPYIPTAMVSEARRLLHQSNGNWLSNHAVRRLDSLKNWQAYNSARLEGAS